MNQTHSEYISQLEGRISELNQLCANLDPYATIDEEEIKVLKKFNIQNWQDPFKLTNQLVLLLEDSIEELHRLKNEQKLQ